MYDPPRKEGRRDDALQKLTALLNSRRSKFHYVDEKTGKLQQKALIILSSIASMISTPILFSMAYISIYLAYSNRFCLLCSLYTYHFYLMRDIQPHRLLPVVFLCIPAFILVDPILGFIYDRVDKKQRFKLQNFLLILSTVGLVVSQAYLMSNNYSAKDPVDTFNACIGFALFSYSLINSNSVKNSFSLTPSQDTRKIVYYVEGLFQAFAVFLLAGVPYIMKNSSDECQCDDDCVAIAVARCRACLTNCQNFNTSRLFQGAALACTIIFALINLVTLWIVRTRTDENTRPPYYSFNKRIFDFFKNQFLASAAFIYFLETLIIFTMVFWMGFFVFHEFDVIGRCLTKGSLGFLCVANDWLILVVILICSFAVVAFIYFRSTIFWFLSTVFSFAAGICIFYAKDDPKSILIVVIVANGFAFSFLPTAKSLFSDATYYDEYRTGYVLPQYLTFIFNLAAKIAFLIAAGAIISATDNNITSAAAATLPLDHHVDAAAGTIIVIATILLFLMKLRIRKFHLKTFDKIQLAIEKNQADSVTDEISFKDPITDEPTRRPLIPRPGEDIRNMLYLDNFARSAEIKRIVHEKYSKVKTDATVLFWFGFLSSVICLVLTGVFYRKLEQSVGWAFLIPLLSLVVGIYMMIYTMNVKTTVEILMEDQPRIDKDYLNKYIFYRKQFEQL